MYDVRTLAVLQELNALDEHRVPQHDHVLRHVLDEREEATLRVEPRVRAEFLLVRLDALDHPRYAKVVVALRAVQRPENRARIRSLVSEFLQLL